MSGDYVADRAGRMHHKCPGVEGWDDIYVTQEGTWELSLNAGDAKVDIKYCPWCGKELKLHA